MASKPSLYHWLTLMLPAGSSSRRQDGDISIAERGCGYGGRAVTLSAGSSIYILNLGLAFCRFSTCLDGGYYTVILITIIWSLLNCLSLTMASRVLLLLEGSSVTVCLAEPEPVYMDRKQ